MDISADTMVKLKVPFLCQYEFIPIADVQTANDDYGICSLNTLLPTLTVSGITAPTYKLFVHLEDLEFYGADNATTTTVTIQAGKTVSKSSPVEKENMKVSTVVSKVSDVVKLFRGVPLISSYASTASWFLDATAGAARAFGWSKPTIQEVPTRMARFATVCEHNVDLPSQTVVLAPFSSNRLEADPSFGGTNVDEMSLAYVLQQYSQICIGQTSTLDTHGTFIYGCNVSPMNMWFRTPAGPAYGNFEPPQVCTSTSNSFQPSTLFFFSQMFRAWKGSMVFRFTFAKTKHHGGRVMVNYNPRIALGAPTSTPVTTTQGPEINSGLVQPFGYSTIFDLKDGNSFEFVVPYTSPFPYMPFYSWLGSLTMVVMDPLQAPSVVTSTVPFMVEVKAGPDFELVLPRGLQYPAHPNGTIRTQAGKTLEVMNNKMSEYTTGERILSVKQLIMIPKWSTSAWNANATSSMTLFPWYYHRNPNTAVPTPAGQLFPEAFSYGGNIATCYVFARGSTDYHFYRSRSDGVLDIVSYAAPNEGVNPAGIDQKFPGFGSTSNMITTNACGGASTHIKIPANQIVARMPTCNFNDRPWSMWFNSERNCTYSTTGINRLMLAQPVLYCYNNTGAVIPSTMGRSAGDDAMLAAYIGPPPLALPNATTNVTFDGEAPYAPS
jgi:hypothetical protein